MDPDERLKGIAAILRRLNHDTFDRIVMDFIELVEPDNPVQLDEVAKLIFELPLEKGFSFCAILADVCQYQAIYERRDGKGYSPFQEAINRQGEWIFWTTAEAEAKERVLEMEKNESLRETLKDEPDLLNDRVTLVRRLFATLKMELFRRKVITKVVMDNCFDFLLLKRPEELHTSDKALIHTAVVMLLSIGKQYDEAWEEDNQPGTHPELLYKKLEHVRDKSGLGVSINKLFDLRRRHWEH